jgi:hypothetical protein
MVVRICPIRLLFASVICFRQTLRTPTTNQRHPTTRAKPTLMSTNHINSSPSFTRSVVFWVIICAFIALSLGSMVALIRARPTAWNRVIDLGNRLRMAQQPLREDEPRQSFHLPIQTPPPSPLPPLPPIPIPTRKPSQRSFDTFEDDERMLARIRDINRLRQQASQQRGG